MSKFALGQCIGEERRSREDGVERGSQCYYALSEIVLCLCLIVTFRGATNAIRTMSHLSIGRRRKQTRTDGYMVIYISNNIRYWCTVRCHGDSSGSGSSRGEGVSKHEAWRVIQVQMKLSGMVTATCNWIQQRNATMWQYSELKFR